MTNIKCKGTLLIGLLAESVVFGDGRQIRGNGAAAGIERGLTIDDYVLIVSRYENTYYRGRELPTCLAADDNGTLGAEKCDKRSSEQLWLIKESKINGEVCTRYTPKSDRSLCMHFSPIGPTLSLKKCNYGNRRQCWQYNNGFIQSVKEDQQHFCLEKGQPIGTTVPERKWESIRFQAVIEPCAYRDWGEYRWHSWNLDNLWDLVSPDKFTSSPPPKKLEEKDFIQVKTPEGKCLVAYGRPVSSVKLVECKDMEKFRAGTPYNQRWIMDAEMRLRPLSDTSKCFEFEPSLLTDPEFGRTLGVGISKCYRYKDNQKWNYNENGDKEIAPLKAPDFCVARNPNVDPRRPEKDLWLSECNRKKDQKWKMKRIKPICKDEPVSGDDEYMYRYEDLPHVHIKSKFAKNYWINGYESHGQPRALPNGVGLNEPNTDDKEWNHLGTWIMEGTGKAFRLRNLVGRGNGPPSVCLTVAQEDGIELIEKIALVPCNGTDDAQLWYHDRQGNNEISPVVDDNLCLAIYDTHHLKFVDCNGEKDQEWKILDAEEYKYRSGVRKFGAPKDFVLAVLKEDKALCISAVEGYEDEELMLDRCDESNNKMLWAVEEGNRWRLKDNLILCMVPSKVDYFSRLKLEECAKEVDSKEKWQLNSKDGITPLRNADLCVAYDDSCNSSPKEGDRLGLETCNGKKKQGFILTDPDDYE